MGIFSQEQNVDAPSLSEEIKDTFDDPSLNEETEDSFDDLFENPDEDTIVKEVDMETAPDHRAQFEESKKITIKGEFIANGGVGFGWKEGWEDRLPGQGGGNGGSFDIRDGFHYILGVYAKASLSFDARPDPAILIYGNFYTEFDPKKSKKNAWSVFVIDELFGDYNMANFAYFRIGQFEWKWGQGKLFTPGNLMDGSEDTFSLRLNMPTLLDGISVSTTISDKFYNVELSQLPKYLRYSILADKIFGNVQLTAGASYNYDEELSSLVSFKTVLWKIDFFADGLLHYYLDKTNVKTYEEVRFEALFGFFREWKDIELYGEYYFDGTGADMVDGKKFDHSVGIATKFKNILGSGVDVGLEWLHSFGENSGNFLAGVTFSPWKYLRLNIAFPFNYGDKVLKDEDSDEGLPIDLSELTGILIFFEIKAGF